MFIFSLVMSLDTVIEGLKGYIIQPTKLLLDGKNIRASDLKISTRGNKYKGHFSMAFAEDKLLQDMKMKLKADHQHFLKRRFAIKYETLSKISKNIERLHANPRNELEVRYAVVNCIADLICDVFDCHLKLEESVKENLLDSEVVDDGTFENIVKEFMNYAEQSAANLLQDTPGSSADVAGGHSTPPVMSDDDGEPSSKRRRTIGHAMSTANRTDYTVYQFLHEWSGREKAIAIIDAKHKFSIHSLAQVIGYYSAYDVPTPPPMVAVITYTEIALVFFPFSSGEIYYVDAFTMDPICMWDGPVFRIGILDLILGIVQEHSASRNFTLLPSGIVNPTEKSKVTKAVKSDQQYIQDVLSENARLRRENRELRKSQAPKKPGRIPKVI